MAVATVVITAPAEAWTEAAGRVGALPITTGALTGTGHPMVFGKYTCDASPSATTVTLGFRPKAMLGWNATDGHSWWLWSTTFGDAKALTNIEGVQALLATTGITPTDTGFTLGVGTGVQTASKVYEFLAFR
jgi:hypothetical protein